MINKKWTGKYAYNFEEDSESFSFEINVKYDNGSFEGHAYEEEFSGLTSDIVHVKGFIESDMISFVKTYPYFYAVDDNGDIIIDKKLKGHEVIYEGYFNEENGSWSGDWAINISEDRVEEGKYKYFDIIGPWEMKFTTISDKN